ncbi:hemolymph lipopolysaccharide-binding protein-like [Leguminivora glycinivorella]|uniref:hemolymph lipopolysaccharide-binding protein-like n=1 Tax=Leguminivora glycinivorella TaxID=1035111 RepID=UPI00200D5BB3|nr:hemolymph lipopolysaccharide-binding protein-like [Leguminivora glycinivorella]
MKMKMKYFLLVFFLNCQEVSAVMDPGYEYIDKENTWLRLHIAPAAWQDAFLRCKTEGYEYKHNTGSCYKFHRVAQTWHRAARICHAEGGHLAIINSKKESQEIKTIFEKNPGSTIFGAEHDFIALIGAWNWNIQDGEWLTVNGQTLEEAGFADRQPNNLGGDQTVLAVDRAGKLNDISPQVKEA